MADLRIVDAPLLSTVKGTEKIPTGGEGNFSVSVNQVADFAKLKWFLATEGYVDNAVGNVQADLNLHKNNSSNPHQVTKGQVGLGNVDNTADLDKPVSNATQSAIITATQNKATNQELIAAVSPKADITYVDDAVGAISTDASKQYATLALATADIANIALNRNIFVSEVANGGYWYKATAGATSLTKSPFDPVEQAKLDATAKANAAESEAKNAAVRLTKTPYGITQLLVEKTQPTIETLQFGYLGTTTSGTSAPAATYVLINPATTETIIDKFSIVSNIASGSIELRTYSMSGNVLTMLKKVATLKVTKVGINTFTQEDFIPFSVAAGQYVAVTILTAGAMNYDAAGSGDTYYSTTTSEAPFTTGAAGVVKIKAAFYKKDAVLMAKTFIDKLEKEVLDSNNSLSHLFTESTLTKGLVVEPSAKSGVNGGSGHYCIGTPIEGFGNISSVKVYSAIAGAAQVGVYSRDGTAFTRKASSNITLVAGLNDITVNLPVSDGDYIGLRTTATGMIEYETTSLGHDGMFVSLGGSTENSFTTSSTTPTLTFAYQLKFNLSLKELSPAILGSKKWLGKKYTSFGDSITWYNGRPFALTHKEAGQIAKGYQSYVVDELGGTLDNKGESGWDMPQIYASRINTYDFTDCYLTTITSGANDCRKGVPVGTLQPIGSTFNTSTYAGAMQASIEKVISSNPDTKIILITPIRGWYSEYNTTDVPNTDPTVVGVMKREYPDMVKAIAKLYGLPIVDFYDECELNDLNKNYFLGDNPAVFTAYLLHPMNRFFQRMGEIALRTLRAL